MQYFVYILSCESNSAIYVGVTNNLIRRVWEHKNNADPGSFTARYNIHKLVYYETTGSIEGAIAREKQLKSWRRSKKVALIESANKEWHDLYNKITE